MPEGRNKKQSGNRSGSRPSGGAGGGGQSRADGGGSRARADGARSRTADERGNSGRGRASSAQSGARSGSSQAGKKTGSSQSGRQNSRNQTRTGSARSSGERGSADGRMRLNRAIASTGLCSRRQADELIEAGRVKVNNRVTRDFSMLVDPYRDRLTVEGRAVKTKRKEYVILYKPTGILTTCDDERGRKTVLDILPETLQHLKPVGRLDKDSEGLLVLTNDGDLAQRLTHPSQHIWKTYVAVVEGKVSQQSLAKLRGGIELSDGMTSPARITDVSINPEDSSFRISIREGRNRQIRRMCIEIGHPVIRLVRVAIGRLQLRSMEPFDWRYLSKDEVEKCCED